MNDELMEKEKQAIKALRAFEPQDPKGYYLCYSGGKDSDCIRILAALAGVKHEIVHNLTTVDAPETVKYVKSIPGVIIRRPELSMWQLIPKKLMPPTRLARYCCEELKERGGSGRLKITGVRKDESKNRAENSGLVRIIGKPKSTQKLAAEMNVEFRITRQQGLVMNMDDSATRQLTEMCYRTRSTMVNPIIDWTESDVWEFLNHYGCEANPLYKCGEKRIGCIGCPMQGSKGMKSDFIKYPKYRTLYVKAFERMLEARKERYLPTNWETGEDVMRWWVGDNPLQLTFADYEEFLDQLDVPSEYVSGGGYVE